MGQASIEVTNKDQGVTSGQGSNTIIKHLKQVRSSAQILWGGLESFLIAIQNIQGAIQMNSEMKKSTLPNTTPRNLVNLTERSSNRD